MCLSVWKKSDTRKLETQFGNGRLQEGCSNLKLTCVLYHFAADWHNAVVMLYKEQVQSCYLPPEEGAVLLSLLLLLSFWKGRALIPL